MPIATVQRRSDKLNAKGFLAFEVDGVLARATKKQASAEAPVRLRAVLNARFGAIVLGAIRDRMRTQGVPFQYDGKESGVRLSPEYRTLAGLGRRAHFGSEAEMHAAVGVKPGTFDVTGGMWEGAQARASGEGVILDFGGSSPGRGRAQVVNIQHLKRNVIRMLDQNVQNREKAATILGLGKNGVHVLTPTDGEAMAMAGDVLDRMQRGVRVVFEAVETARVGGFGEDEQLLGRLQRDWVPAAS